MNRTQLHNVIESGRSIALDCYAIGKSISDHDPVGRLFKNDILNKSIILKRYEAAEADAPRPVIVNTLVYFPYDYEDVYGGGESLDFSDTSFHRHLTFKICSGEAPPELKERIVEDIKTLYLLDSMHSLDPFLFKSRAEQSGADEEIHDAYFEISEQEWENIRTPIREKIARLVAKALGGDSDNAGAPAREQYVERFLMKIWQAKDVQGIEPFIKAMQIEPEKAPEVFFAWKAVCYYQVRFGDVIEGLKTLFRWVGNDKLCVPSDFANLTRDQRDRLRLRRELLRKTMRESYAKATQVLDNYENSYDQFVHKDHPQAFMSFLADSDTSYLTLAAHVSSATHGIKLWEWYVELHGEYMLYEPFMELFDGLSNLYGVKQTIEEKAWQSEPVDAA